MAAEPTEHRRARRAAGVVATAVVAVAGGVGLLLFFVARDDAPVDKNAGKQEEAKGPGQSFADLGARHVSPAQSGKADYNSDPPTSGPHVPAPVRRDAAALSDDQILHALEQGNVVLAYGSASPPGALRSVAEKASGGPFDPALVSAGQAVIL